MLPAMGSMTNRGRDRYGDDVWELAVRLGWNDDAEAYGRYTERFHGPRVNARRRLRDLETRHDEGRLIRSDGSTLAAFLRDWLDTLPSRNLAARTCESYRREVETHIIPALGRLRLVKITPQKIAQLQAKLTTQGLAAASVAKVHTVLSSALTQAEEWGLIDRNPARRVSPPRVQSQPMCVLSPAESEQLLATIAEPNLRTLVLFALTTGLRRGEIVALQWEDIDLAATTVTVRRAADYGEGRVRVADPKTDSSRRLVTLPERTVRELAGHDLRQDELRRKLRGRWRDLGLVFPVVTDQAEDLPAGRMWHPSSLTHRFKALARAAGFPALRLHDLRHTHATQLLQSGVNVKVVGERLGHGDVSVTLRTYAHVLPDMQDAALEALDKLYRPEST